MIGGMAGIIAKTIIAPIERVKYIFMVKLKDFLKKVFLLKRY